MRRSILAAGAAAAITAAVLVGPAGAFAAPSAGPTTIHLTAHFTHASLVDAGPAGPSGGDQQVVVGTLTKGGARAGRFGFVCEILTGAQKAPEECSATGSLSGGTITLEGASSTTGDDHTWAVVGGTGIYRDAAGQAHVHDVNNTTSEVTIELD